VTLALPSLAACLSSILSDHGMWVQLRRDVKKLEENESAGRALEPEQEKALLQKASRVDIKQGNWSPHYTVTVVGLNTGLRHSEVRNLHWREVDLEKRVLVVGRTKTKAGSGRAVPLIQPALGRRVFLTESRTTTFFRPVRMLKLILHTRCELAHRLEACLP
jgi:integrase